MTNAAPASLYDIDCVDVAGNPLPLRQFAGRPLLIVNTASLCGFARQFKALEALWQQHRDQGLMVIGVPSNDFGHQEPGSSAQIVALCTTKFGITFPLLAKTHVAGNDAHPLFRWLAAQGGTLAKPRWNFYKYVIDRDGNLQDWFSPFTTPASKRMQQALAQAV